MKKIILLVTVTILSCCVENDTQVASNSNPNASSESSPGGLVSEGTNIPQELIIKNETSEPGAISAEPTPSEMDAYLDAASKVLDLASGALEKKRIKDSLKLADKEKMYAYKIGMPMQEKEQVFEIYKKLQEAQITNIYVVRNPDDDYILVKYEAKDSEELNSNLEVFKTSLTDIINEKIEVINLVTMCDKKDVIKKWKNLKKHKEDLEIPCLVCD